MSGKPAGLPNEVANLATKLRDIAGRMESGAIVWRGEARSSVTLIDEQGNEQRAISYTMQWIVPDDLEADW